MIDADVLDELYGVDLAGFVDTRTRLAKAAREAGDKDAASRIGGLRKPTVAAWAVNRLVRDRPIEVETLLAVGERMREATSRLDMDRLRELRPERDRALDSFTRAARFVADDHGHPLSVDASAAVRATAVAALADADAADAVAGGALVRTLDYAGFGEVDLSDAVAAEAVRRRSHASDADASETGIPETGATGARSAEDEDAPSTESPDAADVREKDDREGARHPVTPGTGRATTDAARAEAARSEAARAEAEAEATRRRHEARLREELEHADRDLAQASLVEAEARRRAEKAEQRRDDLARLLDAAQEEARAAAEAAAQATRDREAAAEAHDAARTRLDALTRS
ncbi:hypothetical protein [Mobilicoccus pelagius]|uniref:Uncharacterized protein n=1 Tax=Mobilicoccus pelagius NBRC 104925 TaxID=1089455 RepID=H5UT25_9MICO|nr:hypothetical protein [Mobilicoccus pelagius]GAB48883.1 hypothetical protein MOPEL_084_00180 [Mobilicoccus pelagius NBRC 104925]